MDKGKIESDFEFLKSDDEVLAILVFGSSVKGREHSRSDVDICVVAPEQNPWEILREVYSEVDTEGNDYDVHTFEELSLKMKHSVMEDHVPVWIRDHGKLKEYFYRYRKLWQDQAKARGVT